MKTNRDVARKTARAIKTLELALNQSEHNAHGSQGSERLRYNDEQDGIRAELKRLGA